MVTELNVQAINSPQHNPNLNKINVISGDLAVENEDDDFEPNQTKIADDYQETTLEMQNNN